MSFNSANLKVPGLTAGADLSAKQYRFVAVSANLTVNVASADGQRALGVLLNDPLQDQEAEVIVFGTTKVEAGEAITAGDYVKTDSVGRAAVLEPTATGADVGSIALGMAIESASAAGSLVTIVVGVTSGRVFVS